MRSPPRLPLRPLLGGRTRPALLLASVLALALLAPGALAREASFAQMRDLLQRGYYNSAAHLAGPNLVQEHPDDPESHLLYATSLFLVGELDAAAARLAIADERATAGIPASHVHLGGLIRAAQGDAAGAVRPLQNAFLRTQSFEYAMDWARIAWQAGMYREALAGFESAAGTEAGRTSPWPHLGMGRLLAALGQHEEAIEAFDRAILVYDALAALANGNERLPSPAYVEAYFRIGEVYEALGELVDAEVAYKAARSVDPNFGPAVEALDRLARRLD